MGCFYPAGSPRCGSVQTCWSKLSNRVVLIPVVGHIQKTPLRQDFCSGDGWIAVTALGVHPAGSPRCGSVQTCWSKLVTRKTLWGVSPCGLPALRLGPNLLEQVCRTGWFSSPVVGHIQKTPLRAVGFFVYGALGWIRTTDRPVRSRVLYPAELRVLYCLLSEAAYYRGAGRLCQQSLGAFKGFFCALF